VCKNDASKAVGAQYVKGLFLHGGASAKSKNYYALNDHLLYKHSDEHKQILMPTYNWCVCLLLFIFYSYSKTSL